MLGIDIGSYSVKAAVVSGGRRPSISQFFYSVLPEAAREGAFNDELKSVVRDIIKKSRQSEVVFSISSSNAIMKTLPVEKRLSGDSLEGEVQMAMINFVPFPLDQVYMDFVEMGPSEEEEGKKDVFVVAAKKDHVEKVANLANAKNVKNKIVDLDVFAYAQVLEIVKGKKYRENYGIIDIGHKSTQIFIFKEGELLYSREQQVGGQQLTDLVSEVYDLDPASAEKRKIEGDATEEFRQAVLTPYLDSLSEQVGLALELHFSSNSENVETFYVCGGGALTSGVIEALTENVPGQRFELLPLSDSVSFGKTQKATAGLDELALSLSGSMVSGLAAR